MLKNITKFTVHGVAVPKGSTKAFPFQRKNGTLGAATTNANPKTKDWQELISWASQDQRKGKEIIDGAVVIHVHFFFKRPKSVTAKKRPLMIVKPDLDKLQRAIGDALEGVLYTGDSRVIEWKSRKDYDINPRVEIMVAEEVFDSEEG